MLPARLLCKQAQRPEIVYLVAALHSSFLPAVISRCAVPCCDAVPGRLSPQPALPVSCQGCWCCLVWPQLRRCVTLSQRSTGQDRLAQCVSASSWHPCMCWGRPANQGTQCTLPISRTSTRSSSSKDSHRARSWSSKPACCWRTPYHPSLLAALWSIPASPGSGACAVSLQPTALPPLQLLLHSSRQTASLATAAVQLVQQDSSRQWLRCQCCPLAQLLLQLQHHLVFQQPGLQGRVVLEQQMQQGRIGLEQQEQQGRVCLEQQEQQPAQQHLQVQMQLQQKMMKIGGMITMRRIPKQMHLPHQKAT